MRVPSSSLFTPLPLETAFNCDRATLDERLKLREDDAFGSSSYRGIPFQFGAENRPNAILLDGNEVSIATSELRASYLVFAHIVEERPLRLPADSGRLSGRDSS